MPQNKPVKTALYLRKVLNRAKRKGSIYET